MMVVLFYTKAMTIRSLVSSLWTLTSGGYHSDWRRLEATGRKVGHVTMLWRHSQTLQHTSAVTLSLGSEQCDALCPSVLLAVCRSVARWCVDVFHQPAEAAVLASASPLLFFLQFLRRLNRLLVHTCLHHATQWFKCNWTKQKAILSSPYLGKQRFLTVTSHEIKLKWNSIVLGLVQEFGEGAQVFSGFSHI